MRGSSIRYLFKEGLKNVWINRLMSIASVGILTSCLLLLGFALLLTSNLNSLMGYVEQQVEVVVFIRDDAEQDKIDAARTALTSHNDIAVCEYISKEDALNEMKTEMGDSADLLDDIEDTNPFPASFRITLTNLSNTSSIKSLIESFNIHEKIKVPQNYAKTITSIRDGINSFGSIAIVILVLISIIVISNTIRATVFARRTEIGIMKQVGATRSFIRFPFLIEGAVLGLIAAVFAFLTLYFIYSRIIVTLTLEESSFISEMIKNVIPFRDMSDKLITYFGFGGIGVGILASALSLRSYLKH